MGLRWNSFILYPWFFFLLFTFCSSIVATALIGISVDNPAIEFTPTSPVGDGLSNDAAFCKRIQVAGISRWKLGKYSSVNRLIVVPSVVMPEKFHSKFQICLHKNLSLGLCQCEKGDWENLQNGMWMSIISPYEDKYIDVKIVDDFPGSISVTVEEEFQAWRLSFCALGILLLLLAPIVSSWVPFYYSSSMAIGVCLVIIILLFQGMKLLPTGRKNIFYITTYGSVLGAGSCLAHYFTILVNSILVNFGLNEEMHNPVAVFLLVGIIIAGAGLGYWLVRKFVVSEDGNVDVGIAQFVKWAIRTIAVTFIFQSTMDTILALMLLGSISAIWFSVASIKSHEIEDLSSNGNHWMQHGRQDNIKGKRPDFLHWSGKKDSCGAVRNNANGASHIFKGLVSPSNRVTRSQQHSPFARRGTRNPQDYYSTFHKTPNRKKYTKQQWAYTTQISTREAVAHLTSSPEFTDWIINNADRIRFGQDDSSDETIGSGSDSTDEHAAESCSNFQLFRRWHS